MAGTFNTIFATEIILKLPELNYSMDIYAKFHLTNKLLNYCLILGRDILCKLGIIFNFKNKTITYHLARNFNFNESTKLYAKDFFVIRESCTVRNVIKRIKHILDVQ